jgi:multiple sugar transport system substrate-binding protein
MFSSLLKGYKLLLLSIFVSGLALFLFFVTPTQFEDFETDESERIYFADNISAAHRKVIEAFNSQHRGRLEVTPIDLPFTKFSTNERKQLLIRALRSKNSRIDVFAVDIFWIPRFAKWSEPLTQYFTPQELSGVLSYALESCYHDSELVAMPLYLDIGVMYYRRDLLQNLPDFAALEQQLKQSITWEDFIKLHQRLAADSRPFYLFPADNYEGLMCSFIETLAGQQLAVWGGDFALDSPAARRGLGLLVDLVQTYHLTPRTVTEFREVDAYQYALERDALFFRGWPGNLKPYLTSFEEKVEKTAVAALPHFKGHKPVAVFGGWNLMIASTSTKKAAALEFLKFVASPQTQKLIYEEMGYLPTNLAVYADSLFVAEHPELRFYRDYLKCGFHRPAREEYTKISDIVSYYARLAIRKEISVDEALRHAADHINLNKVLIY